MFKLIVKYLERKGWIVVRPVSGLKTVGEDTQGNRYVFFRK